MTNPQLTVGPAVNANYQYDVLNRLTQLTDAANLSFTFAYDTTDKLTSRTAPNGVVSTYQYDGLDRLTRLTHAKGANVIADFQYQFNTANNISQIIDAAGTHSYSYDVLDRLTAATHPDQPNESYTCDAVGNRTASHQGSSYSYQPFNRLTAANGTSYAYDANGNLTSKTDASGSWTYSWDYENRLKQAALSGGVTVYYAYDALGRRILRSTSASFANKFVYDGGDVVRDLNADLTVAADYLNGPGVDKKLRQTAAGTAGYFLTDHLGSTRALTDAGGVSGSVSYDSFGNVASDSASTRYTYTSREVDADTALIYYRARWYDPQVGRFVSADPIGFDGGVNWYAYVENNPVDSDDPFGLIRPLPRSRTGTRLCDSAEYAECAKVCGPRGVQSCRISQTFRIVRSKNGKHLWKWVDGPPSCSCNDCDGKNVPVPVPVPAPTPTSSRKQDLRLRPDVLVPKPETEAAIRNAAVAGNLTAILLLLLILATAP